MLLGSSSFRLLVLVALGSVQRLGWNASRSGTVATLFCHPFTSLELSNGSAEGLKNTACYRALSFSIM